MCKPAYQYDNTPMAHAIQESVHSALKREVLHAVLIDGWSYERTAEAVGRTPRQVGYILSQEIPRLEEWICQKTSF